MDLRSITHIKEDFAFYLTELLEMIRSDQVIAVIAQETLAQDIVEHLSVYSIAKLNEGRPSEDSGALALSPTARSNLKIFLEAEYKTLKRLSMIAKPTNSSMGGEPRLSAQ